MKYRLKFKQASGQNKTKKYFLQRSYLFFFWEDVEIRRMKLYSEDKELLLKTTERTFNITITHTADMGDVTLLMYKSN